MPSYLQARTHIDNNDRLLHAPLGHTDDTAPSVPPATWASLPLKWFDAPRTMSTICSAFRAPFAPDNWTRAMSFTWWRTVSWCASQIMRLRRRKDCILTVHWTVTSRTRGREPQSPLSNWKHWRLPTIIVQNRRGMCGNSCRRTRDWTCGSFRCGFKIGTWVLTNCTRFANWENGWS